MMNGKNGDGGSKGFGSPFRALSNRNYRLFFCGQGVSLVGTWMQQAAVSWLVYRLTHSPFHLGLIGFCMRFPTFIAAPFSGVMVDKWNRRKVVIITQILAAVQAATLALLVLSGRVEFYHVAILSFLLGLIKSLDVPARQSFVVEMIDRREDLGPAIALNSSLVHAARLVGPSLAGLLIAALGEGLCFLINAVSYIPVTGAYLAMDIPPKARTKKRNGLRADLKDGVKYAFGFNPIRACLLMLALMSLTGMPYVTLLPIFAEKILKGGPMTLGFLMGGSGLGALAGGFFLASRKNVVGLERLIPIAAGFFGSGLIGFSLSEQYWSSLLLMPVVGFGMMIQLTASNTIIQTIVEEDKRGRVMSFYAMSFMGMATFGSLGAGVLAGWIGAPGALTLGGAACLVGAVLFASNLGAFRRAVEPIYREKGYIS